MNAADEFIVELALKGALITPADVAETRSRHFPDDVLAGASRPSASILELLYKEGVLSPSRVAEMLATLLGVPLVAGDALSEPSPDAVARLPASVAIRYSVVPIHAESGVLTVAIDNPLDGERLEHVRAAVRMDVESVVADRNLIESALERIYATHNHEVEESPNRFEPRSKPLTRAPEGTETPGADQTLSLSPDEPIVEVVGTLISDAINRRASDIHLEPMAERFRVRNRIDGVLHEVSSPPKRLEAATISRLKIMANLSISEKRIPQDGRIRWAREGRTFDLRVSSLPTTRGESIVMRVLDGSNAKRTPAELGFEAHDAGTWSRLATLADGMLLVTGPTGSGKTTTLYSLLNSLNRPTRKIVTVEDPVEYQLPGINQVPVNAEIGMTFAKALRALLRQAPNIVMIGEIRDRETAEIAANAALTGHLVFSTLHTNDACGAVSRLIDLGVKPFMVSSALRGVLAQRLARKVCPGCKAMRIATDSERAVFEAAGENAPDQVVTPGAGCVACQGTGFMGRVGLFELLVLNEEMQRMLHSAADVAKIRSRWRAAGGCSLRRDGLRKVRVGLTTLEEVISITVNDEN